MINFEPSTLRYNESGLLPVIAQDESTLEVLMLAWMNKEAIERTLETGKVTYWSRSRSEFWVKGETSGNTQDLVELRFDCDRDALLAIVKQKVQLVIQIERVAFLPALLMDLNLN